ncbi:MAG TPA: hypothetical protein VFC50_01960 [Candidatus Dormibacteraeota bacterium]|nr:hypothetical protein [Candidatus Dormibacteraeota bacterium]
MSENPGYDLVGNPAVRNQLVQVGNELQERARLLECVEINERGAAVCTNPDSGNVLTVVAVTVDDDSNASQVPIAKGEDGRLAIALPVAKLPKVGFFISYENPPEGSGMSAALRLGDYPGQPTVFGEGPVTRNEILLNLAGIKPEELDEARWAEQVGLFTDFGLAPERTRGQFSTYQLIDGDVWEAKRILYRPEDVEDIGDSLEASLFQVHAYEIRPQVDFTRQFEESGPPLTFGSGIGRSATRGVLATGNPYESRGSTSGIRTLSLQGALEITVTASEAEPEQAESQPPAKNKVPATRPSREPGESLADYETRVMFRR